MAGFKSSVRSFGVALWVAGFAAACSQLLGEVEIDPGSDTDLESLRPDAGDALPIICEDGQTRCDGPLLQRCIDGGRAWLTTNVCPTEALCQATDGTSVSQCLPAACAVDQMSCDGANLLLCNEGRSGWNDFLECLSNAHCDATARTCLDAPCEAGQLRCNVGHLEKCNDLRTDWDLVDECETNELCEVTRARVAAGLLGTGAGLGSEGSSGAPAPGAAPAPLACVIPECVPGERRCTGDRLEFCNEGRTGWELAETCDTAVLCINSLTYAGTGETPRCVRAACAINQHECTPSGVLQVCDEGRDRFRAIETCIGPPFCNSVEADQGRRGCLDAPCAAGDTQCNGPQRQVCRADRTGFDPLGVACETRDLCNDDVPRAAVCREPVCQRGATSTTEFRCDGATLERCNDQHTGYELFAACATEGLCNAGFGFQGCRPPVCAAGERRCQGDFVQVCNAQRTAFENFERCAAGTCDSVAGSCAMPCELGTRRCNNQGDVEECRDRLVGRVVIADCVSTQLCDGATGTCLQPPAGCTRDGERRCRVQGQNTVLEECRDGRSRFVTLDTCSAAAGEICDPSDVLCDVCPQGSQPVCQGTSVVACAANGQSRIPTACQFGCVEIAGQPDRCRDCALGGPGTCTGNVLTTCAEDADLTGQVRNNACTSGAACNTELSDCNRDGDGRDCSCTPCNQDETDCNGAQPLICRNPQAGFVSDGGACVSAEHCDADRSSGGRCFECIANQRICDGGQIRICNPTNNRFDPPGGAIQCIENNRTALVCGAGAAAPTRDPCAADETCAVGFGCVRCIPGTVDCDGTDAIVCNAQGTGFGPPEPCGTTSTCRDPGRCAEAQGGCVAGAASARTTPCAGGFCDGNQNSPQCLECLNAGNCDDRDACTGTETCSAVNRCVDGNPVVCEDRLVCVGGACRCTNNNQCNDQDACNGVETCNQQTGACVAGMAVRCDPGFTCLNGTCRCTSNNQCNDQNACNGVETCNLDTGACVPGTRLNCDDGIACNGLETCVAPTGCAAGTPIDCKELSCVNGSCRCTTNAQCDNLNACDGLEACDQQSGTCTNPADLDCDDENACNGLETCNSQSGCERGVAPAPCDNKDVCDGTETCDPTSGKCLAGKPLCSADQICRDGVCSARGCTSDDQCDNGLACDGKETCNVQTGACNAGAPLCNDQRACTTDVCTEPGTCDFRSTCTGLEVCGANGECGPDVTGLPIDPVINR